MTRTPGILLPKQARYQLRYTPALLFYTLPLRKRSFGYYTILPEIVNHTMTEPTGLPLCWLKLQAAAFAI